MSIVVCFATEGVYEKAARKLEKSLKKLGIKYEIDIIPNRPETHSSRWTSNTHFRSQYLLQKFRQQILFQHGTMAWWAATLSHASRVGVYGPWRPTKGAKNKNLGRTDFPGWYSWG